MAVRVLMITSDLFLQSRIMELAKSLGAIARIVTDEEALIREVNSMHPNLVILDLAASDYDPFSCAKRLKTMTPKPKILAAFPHIRTDLKLKAENEKIDYIIPNSSFLKTLKNVLQKEALAK